MIKDADHDPCGYVMDPHDRNPYVRRANNALNRAMEYGNKIKENGGTDEERVRALRMVSLVRLLATEVGHTSSQLSCIRAEHVANVLKGLANGA